MPSCLTCFSEIQQSGPWGGGFAIFLCHSRLGNFHFLKQQVSLTRSSSGGEQTAQLSGTHGHTVRAQEKHFTKGLRAAFLLLVLVDQLWHRHAPAVPFVCASGPNKKLTEESLGSSGCWKGMPPLLWPRAEP